MSVPTLRQQLTTLITRTDPHLPSAPPARPRPDGESGSLSVRELIDAVWAELAPDPATHARMGGVLDAALAHLATSGVGLRDATPAACAAFLDAAPTPAAWHLRKNTVTAACLTLHHFGQWAGPIPTHGLRPSTDSDAGDSAGRVACRAATSDEILLLRASARLGPREDLHRGAAALALGCAGAAAAEAPQVRWRDHRPDDPADPTGPATIRLAGRHHTDPRNGWHVTERAVTVSGWDAKALADWRAEAHAAARPGSEDWSILYGGRKALTSASARICYDNAIRVSMSVADLDWIRGLSPGSLPLWAAAHAAVHGPDNVDGAARILGVDPANTMRKLTRAADRAFKPLR